METVRTQLVLLNQVYGSDSCCYKTIERMVCYLGCDPDVSNMLIQTKSNATYREVKQYMNMDWCQGFFDACNGLIGTGGVPFKTTVDQAMFRLGIQPSTPNAYPIAACASMGTDGRPGYVVTPSSPRIIFEATSESNPATANGEICLATEVATGAINATFEGLYAAAGTAGIDLFWDNCCQSNGGNKNAVFSPGTNLPCTNSFVGDCVVDATTTVNVALVGTFVQTAAVHGDSAAFSTVYQATQDQVQPTCTRYGEDTTAHTLVATPAVDGCELASAGHSVKIASPIILGLVLLEMARHIIHA